jgi:hypothetical protein
MKEPLHNLKKEALLLKLSSTEKAALHAALINAMHTGEEEEPASRATPSPFFFAPQFAGAFAALLLVLMGGTAYAAKGSVPGDFLYMIKTNVNEPIEGALSVSVESKIKFHSEVAQTRLEEAEVLASQNRLDASTTEKLESDIDLHLSQRDTLAQALDEKNPGASASVVNESNSSISAHGDVLAVLGAESKSTTTRDNSDVIASRARLANASRSGSPMMFAVAAKSAAAVAPMAATPKPTAVTLSIEAVADSTSTQEEGNTQSSSSLEANGSAQMKGSAARSAHDSYDKNAALALQKRATTSLESLMHSANATQDKVSASVAAKLNARLAKISALVAQGNAAVESGDFDEAKDSFSRALDKTATLSTFIAANVRFDNGLLGNLLDNNPDEGDAGE